MKSLPESYFSTVEALFSLALERDIDTLRVRNIKVDLEDISLCKVWVLSGAGQLIHIAEATVVGNGDRCYAVAHSTSPLSESECVALVKAANMSEDVSTAFSDTIAAECTFTLEKTIAYVQSVLPAHHRGYVGQLTPLPIVGYSVDAMYYYLDSVSFSDDGVKLVFSDGRIVTIGNGYYNPTLATRMGFDFKMWDGADKTLKYDLFLSPAEVFDFLNQSAAYSPVA